VQLVRAIRPERNTLVFEDWQFGRKRLKHNPQARPSYRTLGDHFGRILERANLSNGPHDKWHKLRRMFGTEIARSAGKAAAQQLLGHSTMRVTERYIDPRYVEAPDPASLLRRPSLPIQMRLWSPDPGPGSGEARTG
jgi:integrase